MSLLRTHPEKVELHGRPARCLMCGHEEFHLRKVQVETALHRSLNPEWSSHPGYCLICDRCGHIHWFLQKQP
ncbi:MAG: hypothetical protein ACKOET_08810 [Verrucomicrobiota bacterium]